MGVPGVWQPTPHGYSVFIPNPLPPTVAWSAETLRAADDVTYTLGQLEMARHLLPNPRLLIYASLRREAIASSTIEGTVAAPDELLEYEALGISEREATREVANYIHALEWGVSQLNQIPISTRLILGLHERLLRDTRGAAYAGRYKQHQNFIAPSPLVRDISQAIFVPPPPDLTPHLMSQLESYMNALNAEPKPIQCALAHYQFEVIHPFADGNGRVGRLLILLHLIQMGLLSGPYFHPSVYFERTRDEYYTRLRGVHNAGDWEGWTRYFLQAISHQAHAALGFVEVLRELVVQLQQQVASIRRRASTQAVLECFFVEPVRSPAAITRETGLSHHSVLNALRTLEELGIVRELTGRQKRLRYQCTPLVRAIFEP
ncbi:MAG: Fic family protein [Fimbriimonadales bacterium]|nr:Fic family protein [Fimbriimonadales bacterium]